MTEEVTNPTPKPKLTPEEVAAIEKPPPNVFRYEPEFETKKKTIIDGVVFTCWSRTGMIYEWRTDRREDGTYWVVGDQAQPVGTYYVAKGPSGEKTDTDVRTLRKALERAIMRMHPLRDEGAFEINFDGSSK